MTFFIDHEKKKGTQKIKERSKGISSAINNSAAGGVNNNNSKSKITLRLRQILSEKQKKLKELGRLVRGWRGFNGNRRDIVRL